jgi:hypothetical protein
MRFAVLLLLGLPLFASMPDGYIVTPYEIAGFPMDRSDFADLAPRATSDFTLSNAAKPVRGEAPEAQSALLMIGGLGMILLVAGALRKKEKSQ